MVETDVGTDTLVGMNDNGAVPSSSKTDLYYGYIHLLFSEIGECHGGGKFKERRVKRFEECAVLFYKVDDKFLAYRSAVYADTFTEIDQMRRSIKSGFIACSLQNGGLCMRTRSFLVGSCRGERMEFAVRVMEVVIQCIRVVQSLFVSIFAHLLKQRGTII